MRVLIALAAAALLLLPSKPASADVEAPEVPHVEAPSVDSVQVPHVEAPSVDSVQVPHVEAPEAPHVEAPEDPHVEAPAPPQANAGTVTEPQVEMPVAPEITAGTVTAQPLASGFDPVTVLVMPPTPQVGGLTLEPVIGSVTEPQRSVVEVPAVDGQALNQAPLSLEELRAMVAPREEAAPAEIVIPQASEGLQVRPWWLIVGLLLGLVLGFSVAAILSRRTEDEVEDEQASGEVEGGTLATVRPIRSA